MGWLDHPGPVPGDGPGLLARRALPGPFSAPRCDHVLRGVPALVRPFRSPDLSGRTPGTHAGRRPFRRPSSPGPHGGTGSRGGPWAYPACRPRPLRPAGRIPLLPPEARRTVLDPWAVHRGEVPGPSRAAHGALGRIAGWTGLCWRGGWCVSRACARSGGPAARMVHGPGCAHGPGVAWTRVRVAPTSQGGLRIGLGAAGGPSRRN